MKWLRRILGGTAEQSASWCDGVEPTDFKGYEGAVSLIPCAMRLRGARAFAFAERIDGLLSGLPASRLPALDQSIRVRSRWHRDWFGERTLRGVIPEHLPGHRELFLCLALCHSSGYIRQAAVSEVAARLRRGDLSRYAALALRLVVVRRNDWVDAVAAEASRALNQLLADESAEYWVQALPLVDALSQLRRRDHAAFVSAVHAAAQGAAWTGPLMDAIRRSDRQVARSAVRCALHSPALSKFEVVETALDASDPIVRLAAVRATADVAGPEQQAALLRRLEVDSFMPVRREAIRLRILWLPETLGEALQRQLLDPSRALRAQAQLASAQRGGDPAKRYRAHLRVVNPTGTATALLGLSEVGQETDAALAEAHTDAPLTRVRAAAIRCLARLAGDRYLDTLVAALGDDSPRVSRAAAAGLRGRVRRAWMERVLAIFDEPPHKHVRRIVLRLLFDADPWAALAPLVRCAAYGDADERQQAASLLRVWFARQRGWTSRPPEPHVEALRVALADCGPSLNAADRRELEFLLSMLSRE